MDIKYVNEDVVKIKKITSLLLIMSVFVSGFTAVCAADENNIVIGEFVDLNTVTRHFEPEELVIPTESEVDLSSNESAYQANVGALVVVLAFSDTDESAYANLERELDNLLNGTEDSMKKLFADVSGGKVTYQAQIPQLDSGGNLSVIKDIHPRAYYERYMQYLNPVGFQFDSKGMGNSAEGNRRLYNLITAALDNIPKDKLNPDILDGNGDGEIDNVITLFPDPKGEWADLLWPMSTDISKEENYPILKNDQGETTLGVGQITFQNYSVGLSTLYHETCHSLGLCDIYNYISQSKDLGGLWTPMANGIPYGMNSIERESMGWLTPEIIVPTNEPKEYTLKALAGEDGNAYKIKTLFGQYIYLEYRKKDDYLDKNIPNSGLLAWRYDRTLKNLNGNAYGPPYYQYLYRPLEFENAIEDTANSAFSQYLGRTNMGVGTSMPLYVPKYKEWEVTEENPAGVNEKVLINSSGQKVVLRLDEIYESKISIYDIEEIEDTNEIKFKIKLGKPDTVLSDPVFSVKPGSYSENISLNLTSMDGAEIRYTLDGTDPNLESNIYEEPINVSGAVAVKAVCFKDGIHSNIVEARYNCFTNDDTGSLPFYNGTGKNQFEMVVPYDVVRIKFEDLKDEDVSGNILILDQESNTGYKIDAKKLFGKEIRITTNGTLIIRAESETAKFKIVGYSGLNEAVSSINTTFNSLNDENQVRISTMLRNNTRISQNAKTIIALYDEDNTLVQVKIINEVLYNSVYNFMTGADFTLLGNEKKCKIYVWNDTQILAPMSRDYAMEYVIQE